MKKTKIKEFQNQKYSTCINTNDRLFPVSLVSWLEIFESIYKNFDLYHINRWQKIMFWYKN